jgi:hypothetical protein
MRVRNHWMEANSVTIDRLLHNLEEIQMSNSSPQIPFKLIFGVIRGSANEINTLQNKINDLTKELEDLKKKTE